MGMVAPSEKQFEQLMTLDDSAGPLVMINMLRYRQQADYQDQPGQAACSGKEAYDRYGDGVFPILANLGAKPVWMADVDHMFIAPEDESWDQIILIQWETAGSFKALMADTNYHKVSFHRDAALDDSRLIIATTQFVDFS